MDGKQVCKQLSNTFLLTQTIFEFTFRTQLGADRYNYLPIAYVLPVLSLVFAFFMKLISPMLEEIADFMSPITIDQHEEPPSLTLDKTSPPPSPVRPKHNNKQKVDTHEKGGKHLEAHHQNKHDKKIKRRPFPLFASLVIILCSAIALIFSFGYCTISKLHFKAWANDVGFLTRCVR